MERRQFIALGGTAAAISVAGCGFLGGDGGGDTGSSEAVAEAIARAAIEGDTDTAEDLIHPDAPFDPSANEDDGQSDFQGEINSIETSVEISDFTADNVQEVRNFGMQVTEDTVSSVAENEDIELVRATVELEQEGETSEVPLMVLAATDGDDWLVLDFGIDFSIDTNQGG